MTAVFASSLDLVSSLLGYLLPFLFVLALVIFVHELGHFFAGRWCGVRVETFSLGFGPRLFRFFDRNGTEWALSAIPLGGYVKFKGDMNAASQPDHGAVGAMSRQERADSFPHQPIWKRAVIVAAGPLANFILAFVIFAASFLIVGRVQVEPVIARIIENSAAEAAGFKAGDRVVRIGTWPIESFDDISRIVAANEGRSLDFLVERDGKQLEIAATPRVIERKSVMGTDRRPVTGFVGSNDPAYRYIRHFSVAEASRASLGEIVFVVGRTAHYISGVFAGRERTDQLSGPTRIAYISGKVAEAGIEPLLMLVGMISISIGLINLLPVPILDGGHLMFYAFEALFGRPASPRAQELGYRVGFAVVMALMLFTTWSDITHLTGWLL